MLYEIDTGIRYESRGVEMASFCLPSREQSFVAESRRREVSHHLVPNHRNVHSVDDILYKIS